MISSDEDEDFLELAVIVAFPIQRKIIRERPSHFNIWTDNEFFNRFRLTKDTVRFIIERIAVQISSPTERNFAVSSDMKVFIALRYYATGSLLSVCGDFGGIDKSTASRIIKLVSHHLALLRPEFINFPQKEEEVAEVRQQFYNIAKFPKCIGAIDCTHVKIRSPGENDAEIYRNRKGYFSFNIQTICDANLRIQNIVCRWPGRTHDSTIFDNSNIPGKFMRGEMGDSVLVGDSGYALKNFLMTPFLNPSTEGQNIYNESQIRTRNPVERSYGIWKRRFPILAVGINVDVQAVESIVTATAVLHNIACHFGDTVPRVTREIEQIINLAQFHQGNIQEHHHTESSIKRNSFVRYFESL